MNIIIVGVGSVGSSITKELASEGHDIIVIDVDNNKIQSIVNTYDVLGICGNGAVVSDLQQAGIDKCDLFIAVAEKDELNIISCLIAKQLGVTHTIARVRDPNYFDQSDFICNKLGITTMVNPERALALEIFRMLRYPTASKVESFGHGACDIIEIVIKDTFKLLGCKLSAMPGELKSSVLICAVERAGKVFIPDGEYAFQVGDTINFTGNRKKIDIFLKKTGFYKSSSRSVIIAGGGATSFYLEKLLEEASMSVKIIEADKERCVELTSKLQGRGTIICGEPTDIKLIEEEGISFADAFVALTESDEKNIVVSLYLRSKKLNKVIVNVKDEFNRTVFDEVGNETVVSNERSAAMQIVRLARTRRSEQKDSIKWLYKIFNNRAEALTFDIKENAVFIGKPIKDIPLKKGLLIGSVVRNDELIIPNGNTVLENGDEILIVSATTKLNKLEDALK